MPAAKEYSPEIQKKTIDLYLSGISFRKVAEALEIPSNAVIKILKTAEVDRRDTYQTKDDLEALKEQAKTLYENNHTMEEIAAIVNRSKPTVKQWLVQQKVKIRKPGDRTLAIIVPLSPELEKIPEGERRDFCLGAIDQALRIDNQNTGKIS